MECRRCSFEDVYAFVFSLTCFPVLYYSVEYLGVSESLFLQVTEKQGEFLSQFL